MQPARLVQGPGGGPHPGRRVVELGARENDEVSLQPASHQDLPRRQQVRRVRLARLREALRLGPPPGCRIVEFRNGYRLIRAGSSGNQYLPGRQQRRRLLIVGGDHRAGRGPQAGRRIVDLGARKRRVPILSPSDQHLPRGQERRGVVPAGRRQASGPGPPSRRGIVELGGRRRVASDVADRECEASNDQQLAGRKERGRVLPAGVVHGSSGGPRPRRGVVELDTRRRRCVRVRRVLLHKPSGDQRLAGRQKRRRMVEAIAGDRS